MSMEFVAEFGEGDAAVKVAYNYVSKVYSVWCAAYDRNVHAFVHEGDALEFAKDLSAGLEDAK